MKLVLDVLIVTGVLELALWLPGVRRARKVLAVVVLLMLGPFCGATPGAYPTVWGGLIAFFGLYRIINMLRIVEGRTHERYLFGTCLRTSLVLLVCQFACLALGALANWQKLGADSGWLALAAFGLAMGLVLATSTRRHVRTTRPPAPGEPIVSRDLPSLTVAIPARNETESLKQCLETVIASDYPKLEILVLDDCSHDKTPEIIRSFAHDGVRFVPGNEPEPTWLPKNHAYQRLYEESNGELIVFCGVDVRLAPDSLRALVTLMLSKRKTMMSVIPRNRHSDEPGSLLFQPMRYAWLLALPRRLFNRPPALSTCWIIERNALAAAGTFAAVARSISPESYFARRCTAGDGYSFVQSDKTLGIESLKGLGDQRDTAVRTRYPQLHRRPELVALLTLAEAAALLAPFALLIFALIEQQWALAVVSGLACISILWTFALIVRLAFRRYVVHSFVVMPFAVLLDIAILNYSMWKYEFSTVIWKERNIAFPVMHVVPYLPPIGEANPKNS